MKARRSNAVSRVTALALLWVAGGASTATAQLKPKIYIVFDSSGSMLQDTGSTFQTGDGSPLCTGDGQSSRVYQLKVALFDVLQGIGATEAAFALATFPMMVDPNRVPHCPIGSHTPCAAPADCPRAGESCQEIGYPPTLSCISPCEAQPACSGHYYAAASTASEVSYPETRYGCKVSTHQPTTQTIATCGDASDPCAPWYGQYKSEVLKVGFGQAPEDVLTYFDQQEDHPLANNEEIRVGNGWWTPLGKSLFYAHGYFHKEAALPATDYRKKCERLVVAFFTDGAETCNVEVADPFYPTKWATALKTLGVVTHTVGIDVDVPLLQQIATAGGGSYVSVSGTTNPLKQALLDIIAQASPPAESCNGEDDDCDNEVDEDFPIKGMPCSNGRIGACFRSGAFVCRPDGSGLECSAGDATGTAETCNGIDDDCDGQVDEDLGGCTICVPQPERCNGKDDDCDGDADEDIPAVPCGSMLGVCTQGITACKGGVTVCEGGMGPQPEACDGLDNDCDGFRDGFEETCYPYDAGCTLSDGVCTGLCRLGTRLCTVVQESADSWKGQWNECAGAVGPEEEICDGLDNDCDGETDEDGPCAAGPKTAAGDGGMPLPDLSLGAEGEENGACAPAGTCAAGLTCVHGRCYSVPEAEGGCQLAPAGRRGLPWLCVVVLLLARRRRKSRPRRRT